MLFRDLNYNPNMMKSRILAMFPNIQCISYKPRKYLFTIVHSAHLVIRFLGGKGLSKYFRYLEISTLPFTKLDSLPSSAPEIEVLFVTTEKDFPVLKKAIQSLLMFFFSYTTVRSASIVSYRVGIVYRLAQLVILTYLIG